jgi:hypothetical protein
VGIIAAPTTKSRIRIVYCDDADVKKKDKNDRGWIPAKAADVAEGATVLEVVPLNRSQLFAANDAGGAYQIQLARIRTGLKSVGGDESREAIDALLETPDIDDALYTLGLFIRSISDAEDPQPEQRKTFRRFDELERIRRERNMGG